MVDTSPLPLLFISDSKTWEMPELPSFNKLPAHASVIPYPSSVDALRADREYSPWFQSLNGKWDFKILPNPQQATGTETSGGTWSTIAVPGNWTMQGFGHPQCTNVGMPFSCIPPHVLPAYLHHSRKLALSTDHSALRGMRRCIIRLCERPIRRAKQGRSHPCRVRYCRLFIARSSE